MQPKAFSNDTAKWHFQKVSVPITPNEKRNKKSLFLILLAVSGIIDVLLKFLEVTVLGITILKNLYQMKRQFVFSYNLFFSINEIKHVFFFP